MTTDIISNNRYLSVGTELDNRYTITNVLGAGGFSITYSAIHKDMRNNVAIKEFYCNEYMSRDIRLSQNIHLLNCQDYDRLERDLQHFLQEAQILASLSGINGIVHVIDYFRENKTAYIVMEQVNGISLQEKLNSGVKYSWDDILKKVLPVVDALSEVHKKGLIHRDIKPDNIIITEDGSLTIIDFGAALHYVGEDTHSIYLSDGYAPKEQYLRNGRLGAYTDIYALCAVIYHCLTGLIPENSIQRAVFDELKKPSDIGVQLPSAFEEILIKGLSVESEQRWQNMEEFSIALKGFLPKPPKARKLIYTVVGLVAALAVMSVIYLSVNYKELKIRRLAADGEVIDFLVEAPEDMTADDFSKAVKIVEDRLDTFAGEKEYLVEQDLNELYVTIPKTKFEVPVLSDEDWSIDHILNVLFSFSGKWRTHNSDLSEFFELTPDNIVNIELNYGSIPLISYSGEDLIFSETIDWSTQENYYLKIELDNVASAFLQDYLSQEGFLFAPVPHVENGIYITPWISKGDGKTVYYPIGSSKYKKIAETMYQILSGDTFSKELIITWRDEDSVAWEIPESKQGLQQAIEKIDGPTVELVYGVTSGKDAYKLMNFCKAQLEILDIPFAIGQEQRMIHIRVPSTKINALVTISLFGIDFNLKSAWNEDLYGFKISNANYIESDGTPIIRVYLDEYYLEEDIPLDQQVTTSDLKYLYMGSTRIGELNSINSDDNCLLFNILLPEEGEDVIPRKHMLEYICSIINAQESISMSIGGTYDMIWMQENGRLLSEKNTPNLPKGVDISRFSSLYSKIQLLGGKTDFMVDPHGDNILISFDRWAGSFPNDVLKIVEDIFIDEGLDKNLCSEIIFKVSTWHNGEPATLDVHFVTEPASQSVICYSGSIQVNDESCLESAKEYIESSNILSASEDRFKSGAGEGYSNASEWNYILSPALN